MAAAFFITLRETLEASLLIGIVLGQLHSTNYTKYYRYVWLGLALGIASSIVFAFAFQALLQGYTGTVHYAYEGFFMIMGACFVTWMMWWLHRNNEQREQITQQKVQQHVQMQYPFGIAALVYFAVAREGIETVIFLQTTLFVAHNIWHSVSAILGIIFAVILSILLFKSIIALPIRTFFRVVHGILLFFAAGLVAHGIHELQEAGLLPVLKEQVWNTNMLLPEDSIIGSLCKALFGYNGNPSLLEVLGYMTYISIVCLVWRQVKVAKK